MTPIADGGGAFPEPCRVESGVGTTCAENSVRKNWSRSAIGEHKQSEKLYLTPGIDMVGEELVLTWICGAKDCFLEKIFTVSVRYAAKVFMIHCVYGMKSWPGFCLYSK